MKKNSLSEQELAICRQMGVSPEDYQATREEELQVAACQELSGPALEETKVKIRRAMGLTKEEVEKLEAEEKKRLAATAPLTDDEIEVCRLLGVAPGEYFEARGEK